eukprot:CAMPEP_0197556098 /NCGR_PEP_ID=MMETSP1320-20131121/14563_1 /TAXON_ID=91990 /ORGANISM="Bolidomonas sp., Strain RCC2347" /LENGTH=511 /DNA_ID=CAMNT_0043117197 /DNA_START=1 /DNA_END=1536 /DNA_ORIENTATION=-
MNTASTKLCLHFDVNETILLEDRAGGDTREACLSKIIAKSASVVAADEGWLWLSPDGSTAALSSSEKRSLSDLHFGFAPLSPSAQSYYRTPELKPAVKEFMSHPHGLVWSKVMESLVTKLRYDGPGKLPPSLSQDGGESHFVLPSFFKCVAGLVQEGRDMSVVIRTFGDDLEEIKAALNAFAKGEHPMFPGFKDPAFEVDDNKMWRGRYVQATGEWRLSPWKGEGGGSIGEAEAVEIFEGNKVTLVQDDYQYWSQNGCSPWAGKPCWVGGEVRHIFFDDNIHYSEDDSIVAVRRRVGEGGFEPLDGKQTMEVEGEAIVKVFGVMALLNDDYFLEKVKACEEEKKAVEEKVEGKVDGDLSALREAVLEAEARYRGVHRNDYSELKALARPPPALALTCQAAKIMLSRKTAKAGADADGMTFGSSETIMLVCWLDASVQNYIRDELAGGRGLGAAICKELTQLQEKNPTWTVEKVSYCSSAGAAVTAWIFAVLDFVRAAEAAGSAKRTIPFKG